MFTKLVLCKRLPASHLHFWFSQIASSWSTKLAAEARAREAEVPSAPVGPQNHLCVLCDGGRLRRRVCREVRAAQRLPPGDPRPRVQIEQRRDELHRLPPLEAEGLIERGARHGRRAVLRDGLERVSGPGGGGGVRGRRRLGQAREARRQADLRLRATTHKISIVATSALASPPMLTAMRLSWCTPPRWSSLDFWNGPPRKGPRSISSPKMQPTAQMSTSGP